MRERGFAAALLFSFFLLFLFFFLSSSGCIRPPGSRLNVTTAEGENITECPQIAELPPAVQASCIQQGGEIAAQFDEKGCPVKYTCVITEQANGTGAGFANVTQKCGGPFDIPCPENYDCITMEGSALGECKPYIIPNVTCWGAEQTKCPAGYYCRLPADAPEITGECEMIYNGTELWCGGYSRSECPIGYYCIKRSSSDESTRGVCVSNPGEEANVTCGGAEGRACPAGLVCEQNESFAQGKCVIPAPSRIDPAQKCFIDMKGEKILSVNDCGGGSYRLWRGESSMAYFFIDSYGNTVAECTPYNEDEQCQNLNRQCRSAFNICAEQSVGLLPCPEQPTDSSEPICARLSGFGRTEWVDFDAISSLCALPPLYVLGFKNGTCGQTIALNSCTNETLCTAEPACALLMNASTYYWQEFSRPCDACTSLWLTAQQNESQLSPEMSALLAAGMNFQGYKKGRCGNTEVVYNCTEAIATTTGDIYSPVCGRRMLDSKEAWKEYANVFEACSREGWDGAPAGYRTGYC